MTFLKKYPSVKKNTNNKSMKKIYILLTRFDDGAATFISAVTGCYYTHASIGLEEDMNTFYSFVYKGFIVEKITRYNKKERDPFPCELYELEVCEKKYKRIKKLIQSFVNTKKKLCYTRLGVFFCIFGIPYKKEQAYFCSQFVAEILKKSGAANLERSSSLYLPRDFSRLPGAKLYFRGNTNSFIRHFGIAAC